MKARWLLSLLLALGSWSRLAADPTFVVNSTGDAHDANLGDGICETSSPGVCTLRAAVEEATQSVVNVIEIPPLTVTLSLGELDITTQISISGAGMLATEIVASPGSRIFNVFQTDGFLSIQRLTLRDADLSQPGGAIAVSIPAHLDMAFVLVTNCKASAGGAIFVNGDFTIKDSVFEGCQAKDASNGFGGALDVAPGAGTAFGFVARQAVRSRPNKSVNDSCRQFCQTACCC